MPNLVVSLGGGEPARVLLDCLAYDSSVVAHAVLDANQRLWGSACLGICVIGDDSRLDELIGPGAPHFAVELGDTANSAPRRRLHEHGLSANVIVNTGAIVEPDCVVGDHVHLATGAALSGAVIVGARAHVGIGAVVRHDDVVGIGAVVVKDVERGAVVVGNPARAMTAGHRDDPPQGDASGSPRSAGR